MPLVILLHGSTGTGAEMLRESHLADTADRHGFVVVAPDGGIAAARGFVWNIPGVPTVTGTLPPKDARDDVAYLTDLADRLVATGCVDRTRVYVTRLRRRSTFRCDRASRRTACRTPSRVRSNATRSHNVSPRSANAPSSFCRRRRFHKPDCRRRRLLLAIFSNHSPTTLGSAERLLSTLLSQSECYDLRARLCTLLRRRGGCSAGNSRWSAQLVSRRQ
jgi:hypothetical protein